MQVGQGQEQLLVVGGPKDGAPLRQPGQGSQRGPGGPDPGVGVDLPGDREVRGVHERPGRATADASERGPD